MAPIGFSVISLRGKKDTKIKREGLEDQTQGTQSNNILCYYDCWMHTDDRNHILLFKRFHQPSRMTDAQKSQQAQVFLFPPLHDFDILRTVVN